MAAAWPMLNTVSLPNIAPVRTSTLVTFRIGMVSVAGGSPSNGVGFEPTSRAGPDCRFSRQHRFGSVKRVPNRLRPPMRPRCLE
jgi:hypothetical protein